MSDDISLSEQTVGDPNRPFRFTLTAFPVRIDGAGKDETRKALVAFANDLAELADRHEAVTLLIEDDHIMSGIGLDALAQTYDMTNKERQRRVSERARRQ